jgi:glyoxylase-like metal-dependent hydrolase (beta-lactamase superfamily II)
MTELAFNRDFDAVYGRPERLSGLVRRVVCANPSPFTFKGTVSYIVGEGEVAIIDPGPEDNDHLRALLDAVRGETVSHIVVTHSHRDHSDLVPRLKAATGAVVCAYKVRAGAARLGSASGDITLDAAADAGFQPDLELADGEAVSGRGWTLEAMHTPGHTSDHLALALPEENALFSGDHVMAWSTTVIAPPDGSMADYLASLRLLLDRGEQIYWPGHGPSVSAPKRFVRGLIAHRQMREAAILDRIRRGDRTVMEVVRTVYADLDPKLHRAAAMSALAHIEHLIAQRKVEADGPPSIEAKFRPA